MEQANLSGKRGIILGWGVLWGGLTALGISLFDWRETGRISVRHIVGRVVIFIALGSLWGLARNRYPAMNGSRLVMRIPPKARTVLFVVLMGGLAYALWSMWQRPD
jgi:hypothetical protein